jgi:glutamate-ammonia-ligase adenylyltransferase
MVDIEFIVQYLVLRFSKDHPILLGNLGNIALLSLASEEGLIPSDQALQAANAYRIYREYQHRIRLDGADKTRVSQDEMDAALLEARAAVQELWGKVLLT